MSPWNYSVCNAWTPHAISDRPAAVATEHVLFNSRLFSRANHCTLLLHFCITHLSSQSMPEVYYRPHIYPQSTKGIQTSLQWPQCFLKAQLLPYTPSLRVSRSAVLIPHYGRYFFEEVNRIIISNVLSRTSFYRKIWTLLHIYSCIVHSSIGTPGFTERLELESSSTSTNSYKI